MAVQTRKKTGITKILGLFAIITLIDSLQEPSKRLIQGVHAGFEFNFGNSGPGGGGYGGQRQQRGRQQGQTQRPASEDYYKLLKVDKKASDDEIKKSYKKLARKYHPDKNQDDPETAKAQFQKIANAYDTLSDPEKRRMYDLGADESTISQQSNQGGAGGQNPYRNAGGPGRQGNQQQNFNFDFGGFDDLFSTMFNGFGDQPRQNTQHKHAQQKQKQKKVKPFDGFDEITQLDLKSIFSFYRRKEMWIIYFYRPKEVKDFKDEYITLAMKLNNIVKVAAVDCERQNELCEELSIKRVPQLIIYPDSTKESGQVYSGNMDWRSIQSDVDKKLINYVQSIQGNDQLNDLLEQDVKLNKVLLFTERKSTAPIFKVLSKQFKDKLVFAEVKSSDEQLADRLNVDEYPTVIVITDVDGYNHVKFKGEMNMDNLQRFLKQNMGRTKTTKTKRFEQLNAESFQQGKVCSKSSKNMCFIVQNSQLAQTLKKIPTVFDSDPINFAFIGRDRLTYDTRFSSANAPIIVFKPHRSKAVIYDGPTDEKSVSDFINNVLGGGGGPWENLAIFKDQFVTDDL